MSTCCYLVVIVTGVQMSTAAARMLGCWDDADDVDVAAAASRLCICRADAHVRPRDHVTSACRSHVAIIRLAKNQPNNSAGRGVPDVPVTSR